MCLAIYAPKGTDKNDEFLFNAMRRGAENNGDGMGYAFKRHSTKKVYISKGYKDVEAIIREIKSKKLKDKDELVFHARIGNKGAINTDMCHPFVCSKDEEVVLTNDSYVSDPVLVHNGTFYKFAKTNDTKSDTFYFAKDFVSNPYIRNFMQGDINTFKNYLKDCIGTSRVAILFPDDSDSVLLGDFITERGYFFSNNGYKTYTRNVGGVEYGGSEYSFPEGGYDGFYEDYYSKKGENVTPDGVQYFEMCPVKKDRLKSVRKGTDRYAYYMGIYFPYNAFLPLNIAPNPINYNRIVLTSLVDNTIYDIEKGESYVYKAYDSCLFNDMNFHYVSPIEGDRNATGLVADTDLEDYLTLPKSTDKIFFKDYIDMVKYIPPSKEVLGKLSKLLRDIPGETPFTSINSEVINYTIPKILFVHQDVIISYIYNAVEELYQDQSQETKIDIFYRLIS